MWLKRLTHLPDAALRALTFDALRVPGLCSRLPRCAAWTSAGASMQQGLQKYCAGQHTVPTCNKIFEMRRATSHLWKLRSSARSSLVQRNSLVAPDAPIAEGLFGDELQRELVRRRLHSHAEQELIGLKVFCGPMYAGKTSALAKEITRLKESGQQGLQVVKALVDARYDSLDLSSQGRLRDGHIVTHLGERHACKAVERLADLRLLPDFDDIKVLFIDEAQFLPDLKDFCMEVARSKRVYVAGLDLDYRKERFGQVLEVAELEGAAFEPLTAKCEKCGQTAIYTQRTVSAREQCLVGGSEAYAAVCKEHHTVDLPNQ